MKREHSKSIIKAFLALVKGGLWEEIVYLTPNEQIDINRIHIIAEEQSVVGLVAAGLEHVVDAEFSQKGILSFVSDVLLLEKRNNEMNKIIASLFNKMEESDIKALLVKGQGVALCYERPLLRACGDIDLLFDNNNYYNAVNLYDTIADTPCTSKPKHLKRKHLEYKFGPWLVELHGTFFTYLSRRIDKAIGEIQYQMFSSDQVRHWQNGSANVALPSPDNDVIIVFTHILQHFFQGGIGLRQLCDLCRLLWTYRDSINRDLLLSRLTLMGLVTEWKAFGCLMVDYLGLKEAAMPFYDSSYRVRASKILSIILESGNFGHNKNFSHLKIKNALLRRITISLKQLIDSIRLSLIFPIDAPRFYSHFLCDGIIGTLKGY